VVSTLAPPPETPADAPNDGGHQESPLTRSWILRHPLVAAAAVSSAGAGLVHAAAAGTHSAEVVAAVLFAITAVLQVAWAFYYVADPRRLSAIFGMLLNGSFAVMWLLSRTVGLPIPEALAEVEHVGIQDGIAAMLGLVAATCAAVAARLSDRVDRHLAGSVVAASVISLSVVILAVVGIASPHSHGPTTMGAVSASGPAGAMAGMDMGMPGMDMGANPGGNNGSMPGMDMGANPGGNNGSMPGMDMGTNPGGNNGSMPGMAMGSMVMPPNETDLRFAQAVVVRRSQVVRIADTALANSRNPEVVFLATLIKAETVPEVYQLSDLLRYANEPVSDSTMAETSAGVMSGAASWDSELVKLENAFGPTFDRLFLEWLVRHHEQGIALAGQAFGTGQHPTTRAIAPTMIADSAMRRSFLQPMADSFQEGN